MSDASHLPIELIMRPSKAADRDGIHSSSNNDQQQGGFAFADSVPQQVVAQVIPSQTYFPPGVGQGLLIPPQNRRMPATSQPKRSNLTALLEGQTADSARTSGKTTPVRGGDESATERRRHVEADSASGPTSRFMDASSKARSAPMLGPDYKPPPRAKGPPAAIPPTTVLTPRILPSLSSSAEAHVDLPTSSPGAQDNMASQVRRCISSKELGTLAPPSGSPYAAMLYQREILQATLQQRLMDARESNDFNDRSLTPSPGVGVQDASDCSDSSKRRALLNNETRNRRRAEHNRAVTSDLCEIVTDLFIAEAKLLKAASYGFDSSVRRDQVLKNVINFVSALPPRYALGVDTPSEVLLHMRLMAAARSDHSRAVVHITKTDQSQDLVTISCADAQGLLEYITRMLATGGSRVLDADVMLSSDNIVLDRFVVQMKGRLRLDKLSQSIEAFLAEQRLRSDDETSSSEKPSPERSPTMSSSMQRQASGPLYFHAPKQPLENSPRLLQREIDSAVPLADFLASSASYNALNSAIPMRRSTNSTGGMHHNMPATLMQPMLSTPDGSIRSGKSQPAAAELPNVQPSPTPIPPSVERQRRGLVNREARTIFPDAEEEQQQPSQHPNPPVDFLTVTAQTSESTESAILEDRIVPLIPFEELMLIETLGMGRVSTIYRAAWQKRPTDAETSVLTGVGMVALKVATVNMDTGDTMHVDELRREADIAAMLKHPNVCDLVGVAADAECFCLAYEFCEAGSLLSLLTDTARYYEYLPLALDIANGMAYLHSRQVIHRDLKPSNVLLNLDHRAKISDFGMSVANPGEELTAETGTYRYMAPEVIRHESYSSNADVYSFGILLWQLITREVPFATMTPIQAAFSVAEGRRPEIPASTPARLAEIISACWDQDSHKRPSFTYIAMALADYARMAFSPANVGAQTLQIANEMLATVEGNSTINVDFSTPVTAHGDDWSQNNQSDHNIGLEL